jgi:hypothetical protein
VTPRQSRGVDSLIVTRTVADCGGLFLPGNLPGKRKTGLNARKTEIMPDFHKKTVCFG